MGCVSAGAYGLIIVVDRGGGGTEGGGGSVKGGPGRIE